MLRTLMPGSVLILATAACGARPTGPVLPRPPAIDTLALRAHTSFLSRDQLEGRATGERGAAVAAAYIATQCRALGLVPLDSQYLLDVPLEAASVRPRETVLRIARGADTAEFRAGDDFFPVGGRPAALAGFRGSPVYLGTADGLATAADSLPDLHGKVALVGGMLRPEPALRLARRGAAGIVQLAANADAYAFFRGLRRGALTVMSDSAVESAYHPPIPALVVAP